MIEQNDFYAVRELKIAEGTSPGMTTRRSVDSSASIPDGYVRLIDGTVCKIEDANASGLQRYIDNDDHRPFQTREN